nr:unnamed protein product [Callosobruchus chinensis]
MEIGFIPILFQRHLLLGAISPIHNFSGDRTLHVDIYCNRLILVEMECKRLANATSLSRDLEIIMLNQIWSLDT